MTEPLIDSEAARLELNARGHRYDPTLDPIADEMDRNDYVAWSARHPLLVDRASGYRDFRANYRAAVAAGAIPDDRSGPTNEKEGTS